jgi:SpoVK/Ycf46/Vps4 family AAA+-type ATPase
MQSLQDANRNGSVARRPKMYWPKDHVCALVWHLVMCFAGIPGATIQLWYSRPGCGKSAFIKGVAKGLGVRIFEIEASDLESANAGDPVKRVEAIYAEAEALVAGADEEREPALVLIEDADMFLATHNHLVQSTINTQHLNGYLMAIGSNATEKRQRVPLVLTGNCPEVLHGPLIREGRADVRIFTVTLRQKTEMVARIFSTLPRDGVNRLVQAFGQQPIAFFAAIEQRWLQRAHFEEMKHHGPKKSILLALQGKWDVVVPEPKLGELLKIGRELLQIRKDREIPLIEEVD